MLLLLYLLLIGRGMVIAANASTLFARLIAGAVTLMFFTYAFVNMGMVSGVLPVVGVPLPLMSYGGTALVRCSGPRDPDERPGAPEARQHLTAPERGARAVRDAAAPNRGYADSRTACRQPARRPAGRLLPADVGLDHLQRGLRWGGRTTPLAVSDVELPPCEQSALEMVQAHIRRQQPPGRSTGGLTAPRFAESA